MLLILYYPLFSPCPLGWEGAEGGGGGGGGEGVKATASLQYLPLWTFQDIENLDVIMSVIDKDS